MTSLSKKVRFEVFKRDLFICGYCGRRPPEAILEVDHIVPRVEGGSDDPANLVTSCFACNRGKGKRSLDGKLPHVDELEILAAIQDIAERKITLKQQVDTAQAEQREIARAVELIVTRLTQEMPIALEDIQGTSIRSFLSQLGVDGVGEAVTLAGLRGSTMHSSRAWKWFCGVCWKMIKDRKAARQGVPS